MIPADYPPCGTCSFGYSRIKRFLLDGNGLCRDIGSYGCRCEIKKPVSGIAMGLITDKDNVKYAILFGYSR